MGHLHKHHNNSIFRLWKMVKKKHLTTQNLVFQPLSLEIEQGSAVVRLMSGNFIMRWEEFETHLCR